MKQEQHDIDVHVSTSYINERSSTQYNHHVFKYTVTIHNKGVKAAKLLERHWIITDAKGNVHELQGFGVDGEQPYLKPGEKYKYTSGTVLGTPIGLMQGTYYMLTDDGTRFSVMIAPFSLAKPRTLH